MKGIIKVLRLGKTSLLECNTYFSSSLPSN
jgi:hypothetical protein